jgi:hypothetical protein
MSPITTLSQALETFRKGLEAAEAPPEGILQRQRIREHLASAWQPARESVIGSYRRGTNLRPTRELDYLFVLGPRHQPYLTADPAKALDDVAARVGVTYLQARTRKAPHGLAVTFHEMTVVLIPAFPKHGGGLFIPDTELHRWLPTDPDAHAKVTADADRRTGGLATAVVRALKCWRRAHQVPVRSFHLETMALRALAVQPDNLLAGCVTALDGVAAAAKIRCAPPCPIGDDVDMYLALDPARRAAIATAAGDAADALRDAAAHDVERSNAAACEAARVVFGAPFPAG